MNNEVKMEKRKENILKSEIFMRLSSLTDGDKTWLRMIYFDPENHKKLTRTGHAVAIGNAVRTTMNAISAGATDDEIRNLILWIQVVIDQNAYMLNKDVAEQLMGIDEIRGKYFRQKPEDVLYKRKEMVEKRNKEKEEKIKDIRSLKSEGLTNEEISDELDIPESTVRNMQIDIEE